MSDANSYCRKVIICIMIILYVTKLLIFQELDSLKSLFSTMSHNGNLVPALGIPGSLLQALVRSYLYFQIYTRQQMPSTVVQ